LGIGRIHPDLVKTIGALKYRYSYAQNVLQHSIEAGFIAGLMAAELGLPVKPARRAGLLHDIGKAVSHEVEGSHAVVGAQMAKKCGEDPAIVNAIGAHHQDEPPESILAHLVAAADAVSGARPGARRESLERYVKRLEDLEKICLSFPGVDKSYALQAGREVRVLVKADRIDDAESSLLASEIAKKIETSLTYPGQIKVTVIRETRAVQYAK
jgi:ribonuclease Y